MIVTKGKDIKREGKREMGGGGGIEIVRCD